ncbi:DUF1501 domain-containing protein [soil metagenome]
MVMNPISEQRRAWLIRAAAAGGAGLALSLPGARLAFAAPVPVGDTKSGRLVVVMLRGAMDGLAAVPAVGDPGWAALRPGAAADDEKYGTPLRLDDTFALHPKLSSLHQWYGQGELLVMHAVASPYRERSHFDAQQVLESGGQRPFELQTGWLGRALQATDRRGLALGPSMPLALRGAGRAVSWSPSHQKPVDADLMARVASLYENDDQLGPMVALAMEQNSSAIGRTSAEGASFVALARQAGSFMAADDGPTIAWLESSGWDTHTGQAGRLVRMFEPLDQGLAALREALGAQWATTTVLVMTEFGRSAAMNGSGGTDHGTAGVAFMAGGQVAGGRVLADWPGLARNQLMDARDLRPTADLRAFVKPALQRHLGLQTALLDRDVLPGSPVSASGLWRA